MKNDLVFSYVGVVTLLKKIIAWNLSVGVDFDISLEFLPPANEVCESYVFTPVCHSVHRRAVCLSACWDTPPWEQTPPGADTTQGQTPPRADTPGGQTSHLAQCMLGDTGNKRVVRILLECILVPKCFH